MPNTNEPNFPDITIKKKSSVVFFYYCKHTKKHLGVYPCNVITSILCCNCIGLNEEFLDDFWKNGYCGCGEELSFGYYMFIYLLKKADLLPEDFEMECCVCKEDEEDEK